MSDPQFPSADETKPIIESALNELREKLHALLDKPDAESQRRLHSAIAGLGIHSEVIVGAAQFCGAIAIGAHRDEDGETPPYTGVTCVGAPGPADDGKPPRQPILLLAAIPADSQGDTWPAPALAQAQRQWVARAAARAVQAAKGKPNP